MEAYDYITPEGYGDTFYVYAFDCDSSGANLTPGSNAFNQRINIVDGDFVVRWFKGIDPLGNAANGIMLRDALQTPWFSNPITPASPSTGSLMDNLLGTGWPVLPEKLYPLNGYIGFDLYTVLPNAAQVGQLAFHGVRRRKGYVSDPQPSAFKYYEKPYQIEVDFSIPSGWSNTSGGFRVNQAVTDYDFEMRRIDAYGVIPGLCVNTNTYGGLDPGNFKILLRDTNGYQISNVPLIFSNLVHVPNNAVSLSESAADAIPKNFWPTPPMMYRINSTISFDMFVTSSTPLVGDAAWHFVFTGVRRYPCS